jgi:hypothetical protein
VFLHAQLEVASLPGDPGGVGIGRHPGQVHSPSVQFDEEQDVQPLSQMVSTVKKSQAMIPEAC